MQWTSINGKNYWASESKATYADATEKCKSMGAYLAEPMNANENNAILKLAHGSPWIGANDIAEENK